MIIEREKANGTLTELAGEDIIEFLSITCDYLFKNEPDLYKEVHEIMNPTIKLTRERADEMIKLQREIVEEERAKAEAEREKAEAEAAKAAEAIEKIECSIRNFIQLGQQNGQSFQETQQTMQNIFSISETEAEEKMKAYWNMDREV